MKYLLTTTKQSADVQKFLTYGIKGDTVFFEDVSTDKATVAEMVERINREQLEEKHLMYFIEDELNR
jgi:hypothetical protein